MNRLIFSSLLVITGLFVQLVISGCSNSSSNPYGSSYNMNPSPTPPPPNTVVMAGNAFNPSNLTIAKHTTVTWNNNSTMAHTSTSNSGLWDTGNIPAGSSKTTTFDSSGTFSYHCSYHAFMVGTVTVQ